MKKKSVEQALKEVKQIREGKLPKKSAREFLSEQKNKKSGD